MLCHCLVRLLALDVAQQQGHGGVKRRDGVRVEIEPGICVCCMYIRIIQSNLCVYIYIYIYIYICTHMFIYVYICVFL